MSVVFGQLIFLLRLLRGNVDFENSGISIAKTKCRETLCSLFSIYRRLPKLNVNFSSPRILRPWPALSRNRGEPAALMRQAHFPIKAISWALACVPI